MKFTAYGHENITAKHKTTLEFTKDKNLSLKGDCILGVRADFSLEKIKEFINKLKTNKIRIIISLKNNKNNKIMKEEVIAEINPGFNSDREIVVRKSDFRDERTLAVRADKAACDLGRGFVDKLKNNKQKIGIYVFNIEKY